jgi:hypothetical protein
VAIAPAHAKAPESVPERLCVCTVVTTCQAISSEVFRLVTDELWLGSSVIVV